MLKSLTFQKSSSAKGGRTNAHEKDRVSRKNKKPLDKIEVNTEADTALLHAVYLMISRHEIKFTLEQLRLASLSGENFEQLALNIVQAAIRSLAA